MDQTVKIIHLTTNQILISEIMEVAPMDIGAPDCKMVNPFTIKDDQTLEPWLLSVTKDDIFMISSDKILTLADPTPTLLEKYLDLTK
jgi:phage FluMu protein Com